MTAAVATATIAIPLVLTLLPDEAGRSSTETDKVAEAGLSTVGPLTKDSSPGPEAFCARGNQCGKRPHGG